MSTSPGATVSFFDRVYAVVREIPRGCVASYGQIATLLGAPRAARAVGWALRALRGDRDRGVPWHRVLGGDGKISLRGGLGPQLQRQRLRQEGVAFRAGRVDLRRHAWIGSAPSRKRGRKSGPPAAADAAGYSGSTRGKPRRKRARSAK